MDNNQTTLTARLRAFPRPVWVLFFGTFLNKFGTFVMPFLALYMTRQGFTIPQAGLAIGAFGLGNLLASVIGGHLADIFGRRNTIVLSMFSGAAAMMLLSQVHGFYPILVATMFVGLTGELYRPAGSALLADLIPAGERVTAYSAYRLAFNAGWAFGPATAGFLAGHSFIWLFAGDAATSALFGIVALFALPHGIRSRTKADANWSAAFKIALRDKKLLRVLIASLAIALVFLQIVSTFSLYVTKSGFSDATYGALLSMDGLLIVLFELPLTTITQRFPARRVMALGYLLIGGGFALNAFAHALPLFVLVILIFTLGEMITMPVASAYVADLAPAHLRGRYMGMLSFTWALALMIGPGSAMALFEFGPVILWLACAGLGLFAALIILTGKD